MTTLVEISSAVSRVLPRYDVREAYLFGSFARGEQTACSDIDFHLVCGDSMTFGTIYELSFELEKELGRKVEIVTNPPERMRPAFRKNIEQDEVCLYVAPKREDEFGDTTLQLISFAEPNAESLEAIREGDMFFASGEPGRFDNAADLNKAALEDPEM